jgi:hypothetical protein
MAPLGDQTESFSCRVIDRWGLMGRVEIAVCPGVIRCEFPGALGLRSGTRPIEHRAPEISVFRARVPIFMMRTTVRLVGDEGRVFYAWPFTKLPRLVEALEAAGFTVVRRTTWLSAAARPWAPTR